MPTDLRLRGVYVPLITPFAADGSVAVDAVTELAHHYLDAGAAGLVPLGTTGEASALTAAEKRAVDRRVLGRLRRARRAADRRRGHEQHRDDDRERAGARRDARALGRR